MAACISLQQANTRHLTFNEINPVRSLQELATGFNFILRHDVESFKNCNGIIFIA